MRKLFTLRTLWSVILGMALCGSGKALAAVGDAGVSAIVAPVTPVCSGVNSVVATIHNYGSITISTAEVHWRVNGVMQTVYNFTGNITTGMDSTITIGNFNFSAGGSYTIEAWTEEPNGSADTDPSNDSTSANVTASFALNGTYTIAGATPSFASFEDAVDALITNGVCGPVVFNMRPHTDTMQAVITQIVGADSINTITFQSENGDSSSVILTYPTQDTLINNHLISLNGADYITFRKLTLQRTGSKANGHVIEFTNNATHNVVTNCRIVGSTGAITNSLAALLYSSNASVTTDSLNTFTYNRLENGSLGIYMNGISGQNLEDSIIIKHNQFINQYAKGIQNTNQGFTQIEGNTFTTNSTYPGYAAIWLDRSLRIHKIIKNKILAVPGTGMYFVDCTAQSGVHGVIANNFIQSNDSAGISMVNGDYQDIVHNSILMTGTNSDFAALLMRGSGIGKIVKNNILANTGGGYCYVVSDSAVFGIQSSDHNNLYHTGPFIGNYDSANVATLANWISTTNMDSSSLNVNPSFVSASDLHVASIAMDDQGEHVNNVSDDIDGETRSAITPDIGADEYSSISRSVGITGYITPVDSTCGSSTMNIVVIVSNTGGNPETNFNIESEVTGSTTTTRSFMYSATLAPGASDTVTFTPVLNTAAGGTYTIKTYTELAVDDVHANDTLTRTFRLFAPPTTPTVTPASICGPGSDTLLASSSDTLLWYSASSGGSPIATGPTFITPNVVATTTYYVSAKSACEGPRTPVALTVLPVPNVTLGNDTSVNQGNSIVLNAGGGFSSYLWSPGGATVSTISVNTSGCYNVRVTNASGCSDRDTICVTVVEPFDVGITSIISPANHDCADDTIQVMIEVSNLGSDTASNIPVHVGISGAVTANFNDTISSVLNPGQQVILTMGTISLAGGGNIVVTAYTSYSNDLDNDNDTIIEQDTIIVQPSLPSGIGAIRCGPGIIVLIASASDSVHWYDAPSGGNHLFTGDNYVIPNLTSTTTFYAQTGQQCNGQDRRPVTGTIRPLPNIYLGNDTVVNDSIVLNAGIYDEYLWNDGSTLQTLTVYNSGNYSVCVTDSNNCTNCDTITIGFFVGVDKIIGNDDIRLYPNPAYNVVNVEMKKLMAGSILFTITNIQGQIIWSEEKQNLMNHSINVSGFARGVYMLQIRNEEGISSYKLVVE